MMKVFSLVLLLSLITQGYGVAQGKKNAEYYFNQGEQALDDGKYTMALAHFNECIRLDPYFWDAYRSRGAAKEGLGDAKGALTDYSIFLESRPTEPEAMLSRAVLRYELAQYSPAKEDFLSLLKLPRGSTNKIFFRQGNSAPGTDQAFTLQGSNHALPYNYLGLIETKLKNYPQAMVYFDSAIRLEPKDPHYLVNRGILKEHLLDTTGAVADYEQALMMDGSFGLAIHNIAAIKRAKGEQSESEKMLDRAIIQSPALPYPYAARAYYRLNHKNFKGAIEDYDKVLLINKTDEESWLYRGIVKEKMKDLDGAFIDYTQAITLKNDYARAWLARGTLLARMNRLQESIEDYSVAITWYSEYGLAFYNRALAQQKLGKNKEACEDFAIAEKLKIKVEPTVKEKVCR